MDSSTVLCTRNSRDGVALGFADNRMQTARHWSLFVLLIYGSICGRQVSAQATSTDKPTIPPRTSAAKTMSNNNNSDKEQLLIVFSDLDGTLIHYPRDQSVSSSWANENGNRILELPPSATGMRGIISAGTLVKCRDLRHKKIKLVLMSGMRTGTLLRRLPYLPRADAYCTESGGRIFYPTTDGDAAKDGLTFTPIVYDGATPQELVPFALKEDMEWRSLMEQEEAAGRDGYPGNELKLEQQEEIPISDRRGAIWDFARKLERDGFILDTKSYSTCFRVNRNQQKEESKEKFDALLRGRMPHPPEIETSTNLGCIDFYPRCSGKKNCCAYLAQHKFGSHPSDLSRRSVCLCDDDNDIEMALACSHAFIPAYSSESMRETIQANSAKFTTTFSPDVSETAATEAALDLILELAEKMT